MAVSQKNTPYSCGHMVVDHSSSKLANVMPNGIILSRKVTKVAVDMRKKIQKKVTGFKKKMIELLGTCHIISIF